MKEKLRIVGATVTGADRAAILLEKDRRNRSRGSVLFFFLLIYYKR